MARDSEVLGTLTLATPLMYTAQTMQEIDRKNFASKFGAFLKKFKIPARSAAAAIGCSEATMNRLLRKEVHHLLKKPSLPTDEMLKQGGAMMAIGYIRYSKLSKAEKRKISESIGGLAGGVVGLGSITSVVAGLGAVAGLSGAGISSGLAAMGGIVGGGMAMGVAVAAVIPVAVGAVGVGVGVGINKVLRQTSLNSTNFDTHWEMVEA